MTHIKGCKRETRRSRVDEKCGIAWRTIKSQVKKKCAEPLGEAVRPGGKTPNQRAKSREQRAK